MSKVVFPIKSDTACLLKWGWSSVYLQSGTSSSCHRTKKYAIDPDNFSQFHNLPAKVEARHKMLNGEWPGAGCEYCKNIETAGGVSDRIFQLEQLEDKNLIPPELLEDKESTSISPTILEVYFKNTCNMACVYCGPHFSSKWEDENRKYGNLYSPTNDKFSVTQPQANLHYKKMLTGLWDFLKQNDNARKIQRYHILGGEPFLLEELDQSIAFWARYGHPDLQISIVSNLNIPHERFKSYINKFELLAKKNKIWRLQLTASLDCRGPEQEYVRYGLDTNLWDENFEYVLNKPWICLSINSVISSLTIKSLPNLIEKINYWNSKQDAVIDEWRSYPNDILHSFNTSGEVDDPYIFSGDIFSSVFQEILDKMPTNTKSQQGQKQMMEGIANKSKKSSTDNFRIEELKKYLGMLDSRRGTNWKITFPWLEQINS
jgi:hypothetical protein